MKSSLVVLALCTSCLLGVGEAAEEDTGPNLEQSSQEPVFAPAPAEDLESVQGLWTRTERAGLFGRRTVTKKIEGQLETLTNIDGGGNVSSAHTVKIALRRAGPVKVFTYTDLTFTAGPQAGEKVQGESAYVYKVVGDTFIEIWGVLEDGDVEIRVLKWKRVPDDS